ncbi:MAG TPA: hypothetical protein VFQ23_16845 [Anaerolineales bacterium]|nr:hypothetical protein [Anaerolineales bacterium]
MSFPDIRRSRRWLSVEELRILILLFILLIGLLALNIYLARSLPGGEWFYLRWSGARAFLFENVEPYSRTIAERVQELIYGRIATSTEYPYVLNDPFFIVLLYTPIALFPDFSLARGIWMLLSEAALIGTVLFTLSLLEWEPPGWLMISLLGFGLFSFFSLQSLLAASPTIFLIFIYLAILVALRSYSDELAGALLFLVAYQWEVGALFFLYILIMVFANRRWGVLTGFGMSLFLALVVSFLIYSGWGLPYIRAVLSDWIRGVSLNLNSVLAFWIPNSRFSIAAIVSAVITVVVFIEWIASTRSNFRRILWTSSLSLAATPLVGFAIFPSNHVVLIPALILILMLVWERWIRQRVLAYLLVFSVALLVPFGLYYRSLTVEDRLYSDLLTVLPPVVTILGLYWMRWWVLHSPRTWMDQIGVHR